jgi:hypothetical protein
VFTFNNRFSSSGRLSGTGRPLKLPPPSLLQPVTSQTRLHGVPGQTSMYVGRWFIRWARLAGIRYFCSALAALSQPSTIYYFPHRTLFHLISPHRPATWVGSRAGSPVSVSLVEPYVVIGEEPCSTIFSMLCPPSTRIMRTTE